MDIVELIQTTDWHYAILVFFARLTDVSLGTLRTIAIVHGRTMLAFWLGFFESAIWLAVVSTIVQAVYRQPLLGVVYALGFASGNLVGITIEKWIAMGHLILRVISRNNPHKIASVMRTKGHRVTTFYGQGKQGPVQELYIVCRRKDLKTLLQTILKLDPEAFYVTEQAGSVSNAVRPIMQPVTGWRAIFKKK
ncbi:MAG: DUF5698 domain-containing protein [Desulfofustis sp.]|jgi:uncharacterized protein YebE (UPF0316 family)|nr:DUF5698 domain-containing protein [Desulfofustis sp.]